jgi:hypothetical protein
MRRAGAGPDVDDKGSLQNSPSGESEQREKHELKDIHYVDSFAFPAELIAVHRPKHDRGLLTAWQKANI